MRKCEVRSVKISKKLRSNLITYAMVIIAYLVCQLAISGDIEGFKMTRSLKGQLVPICVYIVMAVSLNLTVGISGELSLGHAGFMSVGAFSGIIVSSWLVSAFGGSESALAAVAGVLLCTAYPALTPTTGSMPGIKAFTAAVFGGIGSIPGAMVGGILLGVIEILGKAYISMELGDAFVFAVLIIVLLVKPTGLLGKKVHEKV